MSNWSQLIIYKKSLPESNVLQFLSNPGYAYELRKDKSQNRNAGEIPFITVTQASLLCYFEDVPILSPDAPRRQSPEWEDLWRLR